MYKRSMSVHCLIYTHNAPADNTHKHEFSVQLELLFRWACSVFQEWCWHRTLAARSRTVWQLSSEPVPGTYYLYSREPSCPPSVAIPTRPCTATFSLLVIYMSTHKLIPFRVTSTSPGFVLDHDVDFFPSEIHGVSRISERHLLYTAKRAN